MSLALVTDASDVPEPVARVLAVLDQPVRTGPEQWEARCPVPEHGGDGDQSASFAVSVGDDGGALTYCAGGCENAAVVRALTDRGVPKTALGRDRLLRRDVRGARHPTSVPATTKKAALPPPLQDQEKPYEWHDRLMSESETSGHYRFLAQERGLTDGTLSEYKIGTDGHRITIPVRLRGRWRAVRRYRPHPSAEQSKILNLKGHGAAVLYPEDVLNGNTLPVLLCEGEWDALLANQSSGGRFVAVTGTGGARVPPRDLSPLAGREVFVAYDVDDSGRSGAQKVAERLRKVGATTRVLDLTRLGLPSSASHGEDISDYFLRHGGTAEGLVAEMDRSRSTVRERFHFVSATELAQPVPPMRWLVKGVWPERSYGVLAGEKKTLKTYTLLQMALAVASGGTMLGTFAAPKAGPVVYLLAEGGQGPTASRVQRLARAMGVDLRDLPLFMAYDAAPTDSPEFSHAIQTALDTWQPALVIVDPLYAFHPPGIEAQNLYARGQMLADLQGTVGSDAALVVADHFRKTGGGELDLDSIAQSGMSQWADSWMLQRHRQPPDVEAGQFGLEVEMGSRQWGGRRWQMDWFLGRFDEDLREHVGELSVVARPSEGRGATPSRTSQEIRDAILQAIADAEKPLSRSDIVAAVGGAKDTARKAFDALQADRKIASEQEVRSDKNGRRRTVEVWRATTAAERKLRVGAGSWPEGSATDREAAVGGRGVSATNGHGSGAE